MRLRLASLVVLLGAIFVLSAALGKASPPEPGSAELLWGDINCSEEVDQENAINGADALVALAHVAGGFAWPANGVCWRYLLPFENAVEVGGVVVGWGDVNCDDRIDSLDALAILREVAGLAPAPQVEPCPDIGERVDVQRT